LETVELDKKEWEAFLAKLAELEKKYLLVLQALDKANSRLRTLDQTTNQQPSAPPTSPAQQAEQKTKDTPHPSLLTRLKLKLQAPSLLNQAAYVWGRRESMASCSRCGQKIPNPTRFCQYCGAEFGKMICSCGRDLVEGGKFCDRCGRPLQALSEG